MFFLRFLQAWALSGLGLVPSRLLSANRGFTFWCSLALFGVFALARNAPLWINPIQFASAVWVLSVLAFNVFLFLAVFQVLSPVSGYRYASALFLGWSATDVVSLLTSYSVPSAYDWGLVAVYVLRAMRDQYLKWNHHGG